MLLCMDKTGIKIRHCEIREATSVSGLFVYFFFSGLLVPDVIIRSVIRASAIDMV